MILVTDVLLLWWATFLPPRAQKEMWFLSRSTPTTQAKVHIPVILSHIIWSALFRLENHYNVWMCMCKTVNVINKNHLIYTFFQVSCQSHKIKPLSLFLVSFSKEIYDYNLYHYSMTENIHYYIFSTLWSCTFTDYITSSILFYIYCKHKTITTLLWSWNWHSSNPVLVFRAPPPV